MTKYDHISHVWLCVTMHDFVWLCMNMCDYVLLCTRVLSKSCKQKFWTKVLNKAKNKSCEQKLWKSCERNFEQKLWTTGSLAARNYHSWQKLFGKIHALLSQIDDNGKNIRTFVANFQLLYFTHVSLWNFCQENSSIAMLSTITFIFYAEKFQK